MTSVEEWVAAQLAKAGSLTQQQQADLRRLLLPAVPSTRRDGAA